KNARPNREVIKAHIDKIYENENNAVAASAFQVFEATQLVIANGGHFNKLNLRDNKEFSHNGFVQRPGSFWRCPVTLPLKDKSFLLTKGKANLVYRKSEELVLIGGTTQDHEEFGIDFKTLINWYELFKLDFPDLPSFSSGYVDMGIRYRAPKRFPLMDKVKGYSNVFGLIGLHKNGFSYPFWGSKFLLNKMDLLKN
ncbi:MAG: hypothetical protein KC493_15595, partial [Bacteriovoracaceae bacterium]|nr:hypothetical protein [Bacteriovoracaceae bacterium]